MAALIPVLFGAVLTLAAAYAWGAVLLRRLSPPPEIVLAAGVAVESLLIFFVLVLHWGTWPVLLALALAPIAAWAIVGNPERPPLRLPGVPWIILLAALPYLVWYLVNALAPEIEPDGITYHLGLPYEYLRLHGFSDRISFYNVLPQGMEMLYTMAFAFGRHSAAKLVSFALFVATAPLMVRIGHKLGIDDAGCYLAAGFYCTAPVVGISGTSTYNDASLVFFTLAAFYLLLEWRETEKGWYLPVAGLLAGFCYAIKVPGAVALAGAAIYVLARRRVLPLVALTAGGLALIAPWMLRNTILTGNPLAPLMNAVFRNPYFHISTERELTADLASYGHVPLLQIPWQLAFGDDFVGTYGPLLLALPLIALAWRKPAARLLVAAALIAALPWFSNKGARFLMPAVAFAALALGCALPRRVAWAALALQAVVCWPHVFGLVHPGWAFRLQEFPWKAALRIQPESHYLSSRVPEYNVARLIERNTPPQARVFSLGAVADAYLSREVAVSWQSAQGDCLADTFRLATIRHPDMLYRWKGSWDTQVLMAVRFRLPETRPGEWDIAETEFYLEGRRLANKPEWILRAKPNRWEMPLAIDGTTATRWRTWEPMRAGMYTEVDFEKPERIGGAALLSNTPVHPVPLEIYGKQVTGEWRLLAGAPSVTPTVKDDLKLDAIGALRHAGFGYLLVTVAGPDGRVGAEMQADPLAWDVEWLGREESQALFRIR